MTTQARLDAQCKEQDCVEARGQGIPTISQWLKKVDPLTELPFGMIRSQDGSTWIAQGNVKAVPPTSRSLDVYADPTGREDQKRAALGEVADAMERVLRAQEPLKEHPNRGIRAKIIEQLGGDEGKYFEAFRKAGLGSLPDDRARPARLADLFKTRFGRDNKGLGSEIITLLEDDGTGGRRRADEEAEELFEDLGEEDEPRERVGGSSGSRGPPAPDAESGDVLDPGTAEKGPPRASGAPPAVPFGVSAIFGPRARPVGPDTRRIRRSAR